jgi:prophage tail gpP-like protein
VTTLNHTFKVAFADGTEIDTVDEFLVTHDMLAAASSWTFALWYSTTARSTWDVLRTRAKNGARIGARVDDALQLEGRIEVRDEQQSREGGERMVVSGRDMSAALVDWDADPRISLSNVSLGDVVNAIADSFGVNARILAGAAAREVQGIPRRRHSNSERAVRREQIDRFRIKPGEKGWQVLDRVCRQLGLLVWSAPFDGGDTTGLVIDTPLEDGQPTFRFSRTQQSDGTFRGNIVRGSHRTSLRGIPTEVTGFAHAPLTAGQDARVVRKVFNEQIRGPWVVSSPSPQPRYLSREQAHTQDEIEREAQREIARAMAGFRVYECDVQGLGQEVMQQMRLYTINTLAHVRDDRRGIDEVMLITAVTMRRSRADGHVATIRMVPRGAIKVIPERTT